jgi:hypothetical protein
VVGITHFEIDAKQLCRRTCGKMHPYGTDHAEICSPKRRIVLRTPC